MGSILRLGIEMQSRSAVQTNELCAKHVPMFLQEHIRCKMSQQKRKNEEVFLQEHRRQVWDYCC